MSHCDEVRSAGSRENCNDGEGGVDFFAHLKSVDQQIEEPKQAKAGPRNDEISSTGSRKNGEDAENHVDFAHLKSPGQPQPNPPQATAGPAKTM